MSMELHRVSGGGSEGMERRRCDCSLKQPRHGRLALRRAALLVVVVVMMMAGSTSCGASSSSSTTSEVNKAPNFIILTTSRSGSMMTCRAINEHANAMCYFEVLHPYVYNKWLPSIAERVGARPFLNDANKEAVAEEAAQLGLSPRWDVTASPPPNQTDSIMTPFDVANWLVTEELPQRTGLCNLPGAGSDSESLQPCRTDADRTTHHRLVKGFKVLYHQPYVSQLLELCKQHDLSVIHLIRASSYRRAISHMIAQQTRVWHYTSGQQVDRALSKTTNASLDIDHNRLKQIMDAHQHEISRWTKYLSDNNIRHKTIFYEEIEMRRRYLPTSEVFREVYEFLGLDPSRVQGELADVAYSKMFNYSRLIGNIAELRRDYPFETCGLEYGSPFE